MTVKVTMEDSLIQPLIQDHLENGTNVGTQIVNAVSFYLKAREEYSKGKSIMAGTIKNGYVNDRLILMAQVGDKEY